ncbi:MAG: hypothetical protein J2P41_16590 [Blastocatellia bacterium]|nr:hypothetical protein [Blastocatellia bacterium]
MIALAKRILSMKLYRYLPLVVVLLVISSYPNYPTQLQPLREIAVGQSNEAEGFAIYLLAKDVSALDLPKDDLKRFVLQDRPVLAEADIITYTKATHELQISEAAFARIRQLPHNVRGIPFIVCLGKEPIYTGAFWSPFSSINYSGVVILEPLGSERREKVIKIEMGYPNPDFAVGADPRADKRIVDRLEAKGKLK